MNAASGRERTIAVRRTWVPIRVKRCGLRLMTRDEELDAIVGMLGDELDDAELDRRAARFRFALRRLRDDLA
jgi:hypothetical protein